MYIGNPLKWKVVTQPFGVNYVDFYKQFGLKGHNGIDFRANNGTPCYAVFDGIIRSVGMDESGGKEIRLITQVGDKFLEAIYYHLWDFSVKAGDEVKEGEQIGVCDNTGKFTTGSHLHFGLKWREKDGSVIDHDNGYLGAIDPQPYFKDRMVDWLPVDENYGKRRSWIMEFMARFKTPAIHKALKKFGRRPDSLTDRELKAIVYGDWSIKEVLEPSMYVNWMVQTKTDFLSYKRPEINI